MAAINQIKLNSTSTTYDINDKRISTTAVSTVSYILGSSSSSLTTISPISSSNLASVLGAMYISGIVDVTDANNIRTNGIWGLNKDRITLNNCPVDYGMLCVFGSAYAGGGNMTVQLAFSANGSAYLRISWSSAWSAWKTFTLS